MNTFEKAKNIFWSNNDINEQTITEALNLLTKRNIDFGDIFFERVVSEGFSLEEGIVKGGSFNISQGVGVRAVTGAKIGFAYSDVLDKKSLLESCSAAHSISQGHNCNCVCINNNVKSVPPLYVEDNPIDSLSREQKVAILETLDKCARSLDPRIVQVIANLSCAHRTTLILPTDDDFSADIKPIVHISISVVMEKDGRREIGSASAGGAILFDTLLKNNDLKNLAKEAVRVAAVNMEAIQ